MKKLLVVLLTVGLLLVGATGVIAATLKSPAEIYADLKGITVDEAYQERIETGKSFGGLAAEAGVLEEYKADMLENRKEVIEQRVKEGLLTPEQAEVMIERMEANQAWCDGTGAFGYNCGGYGKGFGQGYGQSQSLDKQEMRQDFFGQGRGMRAGGCWGQNR